MESFGILGGTFDPPHYGHLAAAETARHTLGLDRILWIPAGSPPHKAHGRVTPAIHRLEMLRLAAAGNPGFAVSDLEIRQAGPSYTVNTLQSLASTHSSERLIFILGSDEFAGLATWRQPEEIPRYADLAVMVRAGITFEVGEVERQVPALAGKYSLIQVPNLPISSSELRSKVRAGLPVRYLVPDAVREYIASHGLYRD